MNLKRLLATFVAAAVLLSSFPALPAPLPTTDIQELGYSVQPHDTLLVTGRYRGQPVQMVRHGLAGKGEWNLYSGTATNRVRLTFADGRGLTTILAMDRGQRITVRTFGNERVEYRLYGPDRRFLIGSVRFRSGEKWRQGLMRTEAFAGYDALIDTEDVEAPAPARTSSLSWMRQWADGVAHALSRISLVSTAEAADVDSRIRDFFSDSAQDARNFYGGAPGDEMLKGALVGAAAFTVRLLSTRPDIVGAAVVAAAPMLIAVGAGVAIGVAADRTRQWLAAKNLGGTSSLRELLSRLEAPTAYSLQPDPRPEDAAGPLAAPTAPARQPQPSTTATGEPAPAPRVDMMAMSDQLDRLEFSDSLDHAKACQDRRDYECAQKQLAHARKFATGAQEQQELRGGERDLEDALARAEQMRRDEEQRQQAIADERLRQEQQAAAERAEEQRRQQQEADAGSGFQWGKLGALALGAAIGGIGKLPSDVQVKVLSGIVRDSAPGQQGIDSTRAATAGTTGPNRAANAAAPAAAAQTSDRSRVPASVPMSESVWHDDMTTRENSGRSVTFPGHETDIPGQVIVDRMSSRATAQTVWQDQGGTVTSYDGCGSCAVGSAITIVVKFADVVDTHVYRRDK